MEAVNIAAATRDYLDSIGNFDTKITLMTNNIPDSRKILGNNIERVFKKHLRQMRISYLPNVNIKNLEGEGELKGIYFNKEEDHENNQIPDTDYFIKPDTVICANGIDQPKKDLGVLVGAQEEGSERRIQLGGFTKIPHTNVRFSLIHNDIASSILAAGSAVEIPSFIFK